MFNLASVTNVKATMAKSLYDFSDVEIAGILIGGGFSIAFIFCMGLCSILYGY
jgi:hypothetical protein